VKPDIVFFGESQLDTFSYTDTPPVMPLTVVHRLLDTPEVL